LRLPFRGVGGGEVACGAALVRLPGGATLSDILADFRRVSSLTSTRVLRFGAISRKCAAFCCDSDG
jgi:hypothetical protein